MQNFFSIRLRASSLYLFLSDTPILRYTDTLSLTIPVSLFDEDKIAPNRGVLGTFGVENRG